MNDLDFVKDDELRKTIEDSIEYIYALYEQSKDSGQKELFREETCRVIVLYIVSAIEAILLYFYKERREKIKSTEYKFIETLPSDFEHSGKPGLPVVVAVQEKVEKAEHQIGLHDLVMFFKNKNLIQEKTVEDILELNDVRNTFHFSKSRVKKCDSNRVEAALQLLLYTLERAPGALRKKVK
ncbi:hypothetical protein KKE68_06700 [Patescibacteria group bacterium]|nr:hypothetical protein [Patescibacteria group bacterium]